MLGDVFVQAFSFAAEHDGGGDCEFDLVVDVFAPLIEALNPVACFLQRFKRPVDVGNAHHRQIGERSGGGAGDDLR